MESSQQSPGAAATIPPNSKRLLALRDIVDGVTKGEAVDMTKRAKTRSTPLTLRTAVHAEEASKASPTKTTSDVLDKENDAEAPDLIKSSLAAKTKKPASKKRAAARLPKSKKTKNDDASFPIPMAPPMMRFTSSAAFSDVSMPIPGLTSSKSFGLTGLLLRPASFQHATSTGPPGSLFGTPIPSDYPPHFTARGINQHNLDACNTITSGDLTLAASALLDLTPAVGQNRRSFITASANRLQLKRHPNSSREEVGVEHSNDHDDGVEEANAQVRVINARLVLRAQRLLEDVPITLIPCKCKNTKCLKLYCNCFQTGAMCDAMVCKCKGCNNTLEHTVPRGARSRAIYEILSRRVDAFEPRLKKKTGHGCSCKKSRYVPAAVAPFVFVFVSISLF